MSRQLPIVQCNGLLFIGDPHLDDAKPARRRDESFADTVLGKIEFAIDLCNQRHLVPVFLGDMFEPENKTRKLTSALKAEGSVVDVGTKIRISNSLLNKLIKVLRKSWITPIANVGNHDKRHTVLTDEDTLMTLGNTGVLQLCTQSAPVCIFDVQGKKVGFGATPYDQPIPTDISHLFGEVATAIWITHHDLAFEGPYPGSQPLHHIRGCSLVVNGHMHLYKRPVRVGQTMWLNPGNITRQYIDAIDHEPAVYEFNAQGKISKIVIPHEKAIFDLLGKLIDPVSPGEKTADTGNIELKDAQSNFASLLAAEDSLEMKRSDDGSILLEEISAKFERDQTPEEIQGLVLDLFDQAVSFARERLSSAMNETLNTN